MAGPKIPHNHGNFLQKLLLQMPEEAAFDSAADAFSQLADTTRLRILWILCHAEECVTNIAAAVGMSDPAVSHHLRILKRTGLITSTRKGKEVHYTLANTQKAKLIHRMIDDIFEMDCNIQI